MTYLMRLNQINFGIITPEKDEPSGLNTYSAKHLCLLMCNDKMYSDNWSLPTEEIFRVRSKNRLVANLPVVDFRF